MGFLINTKTLQQPFTYLLTLIKSILGYKFQNAGVFSFEIVNENIWEDLMKHGIIHISHYGSNTHRDETSFTFNCLFKLKYTNALSCQIKLVQPTFCLSQLQI